MGSRNIPVSYTHLDVYKRQDPTTLLGSSVAGINTNDIETIDVLKDAAATALYGARADVYKRQVPTREPTVSRHRLLLSMILL